MMKKKILGMTGLNVTELCFDALTIGPIQTNTSPQEGSALIRKSLEKGVNFIDTAELYGTYEHIRLALKNYTGEVILASKSMKSSYADMEKAVQDALKGMDRDYIDIFHLHAAKDSHKVFEEKEGAFKCLLDYKKKGYIGHVGIATHNVELVKASSEVDEVEVIFPLINKAGMGIVNGAPDDMLEAIAAAHAKNKGLYAMKALAGGNLIKEFLDAISYVRNIPGMSSVALGMVREEELDINLRVFSDEELPEDLIPKAASNKRPMIFRIPCNKCMTCIDFCPNEAIEFLEAEEVVEINYDKCLLCGYCGPQCPRFAIRMV